MPICYVTVSKEIPLLSMNQLTQIRKIVAKGLNSKARSLDLTHITLRLQTADRDNMLGDIEIEIYAQLYLRRLFTRDKRAEYISKHVMSTLNVGCATWINMCFVGYSRVNKDGDIFFSDADNAILRFTQIMRGISTKKIET